MPDQKLLEILVKAKNDTKRVFAEIRSDADKLIRTQEAKPEFQAFKAKAEAQRKQDQIQEGLSLREKEKQFELFQAKMDKLRDSRSGTIPVVGQIAAIALALGTVEKGLEQGNQELQKFFDGTQSGKNATLQTLSQTAIQLPLIGSAFKSVTGILGTLTAGYLEHTGVSHALAQQTLVNAFNFEKETQAIVQLSDGAMEASKSLHDIAGDIGLKGLEKDFREIDKQIDERVKELSAAARETLSSTDSSADQKQAAQSALDRISEQGENARAAMKAEVQKRNNQDEADRERTHSLDLKQIRDEAQAELRTEATQNTSAQIVLINQRYDRMAQEETARAEQLAREVPEHADEIRSEAEEKNKANADRRAQEIAQANREHDRQEAEQDAAHLRDVEDIQTDAAAIRLRNQHKESEAELLELQHNHEKQIAEIDRQTKEKLDRLSQSDDEASRADAVKAQRQAAERKAALESQFAGQQSDLQRRSQEENATRQETIDHNIAVLRINALKEEAELGDQAAATEARRLERLEKYAEDKREILRMLREEKDLSDEDQKKLKESLASIDKAQEAAAKGLLGTGTSLGKAVLPQGQESRGLTGLAQADQEYVLGNSQRQAEAQLQATRIAARTEKEITRLREIAESLLRGKVYTPVT